MPHRDPNASVGEAGEMEAGLSVEVRSRFDGAWCGGFNIAEVVTGPNPADRRYRLRRLSDGAVLPRLFGNQEVAPSRGRPWFATEFPRH